MRILVARTGLSNFVLLVASAAILHAEPVTHGYRDFDFGGQVIDTPTAEKPESKLWWNDGAWWGCLWNPAASTYEIHRLDLASQTWIPTGTPLDPRDDTLADVLWDGERLYVVSHDFTKNARFAPPQHAGWLFRLTYSPGSQTYVLDPGFPVEVNSSRSETLVIDKDSTGQLWICWVEGGKVKVNRTIGEDHLWGVPFDLPLQLADTGGDDIASLTAFGGDRIGIMWSNQAEQKMLFAVHHDLAPDDVWVPEEALSDAIFGSAVADDHVNLKAACDGSGAVYAVTKTSLGGGDPLIYLLVRSALGVWSSHVFAIGSRDHTRPQVLLDHDAQLVHVVASSDDTGPKIIYMKSADMNDPVFEPGLGTPLIESDLDTEVNDPSSTKQCVDGVTGIVVLASDDETTRYLHGHVIGAAVGVVSGETRLADKTTPTLTRVTPLVAGGVVEFRLELPGRAPVTAVMYDVSGRRVSLLLEAGVLPAGGHSIHWDGRTDAGPRAGSGFYFLLVNAGRAVLSERVSLIR